MANFLTSLALIIMIGYIIYLFSVKSTLKTQLIKMKITFGLVVICFISSLLYFIEGNTGNGLTWLLNTGLWCLNYYINKKHYETIEESNKWFEKNNEITGRTTWSTTMKKEPTNIFKSFINWLKK